MPVRQQRPTLRDVAEVAGVSKTTAVFVLNERPNFSIPEETRNRVHSAAKQLGYRRNGLAAALSQGKTGSIGVVVSTSSVLQEPQIGDDYLLGILLGTTRAASAAGLRLTMIEYARENPPTPEEVTDRRVDGLILVGILEESFTRAIYATDFPCVTIGSGYAERRITADNVAGAAQAVEHLIALGHRRIAYASPNMTEADRERGQGWRETMARHGLRTEGMEQPWESLLPRLLTQTADDRPTAVFCRSDGHAALLMRAVREQGLRIPEDISFVGFDGGIISDVLSMTTVRNPLSELTACAVEMLPQLIAGKDVPSLLTLPTELIVRQTTAAPALSQKEF